MATSLARPTEKFVQASVKKALALYKFVVSDLSQPRASMQTPGLPDLYAQHRSLPIRFWCECKRPGGKLTEAQLVWHENERRAGGLVLTMSSGVDMAAFLAQAMPEWKATHKEDA